MNITILWADDEIELLKPHILFLKDKGYDVVPVCSGRDAIDEIEASVPDLVFLDEQMPGLSGIDTLKVIKERWPQLPVVMITKSEEEHIMEDALGGKISDYLIKPVNPSQILLTVKKHTERKRLQSEHSTMNYQQQFREIGMQISGRMDAEPIAAEDPCCCFHCYSARAVRTQQTQENGWCRTSRNDCFRTQDIHASSPRFR